MNPPSAIKILLVACLLSFTEAVLAAPTPCQPEHGDERPSIGLVLSGGGARGAAHIGVIRVLEELKIPIDCISGTSMGSIIGGLYATGMTTDTLQRSLLGIDWDDAFNDEPMRQHLPFRRKREDGEFLVKSAPGISDKGELKLPSGLVQGQKLGLILKHLSLPSATAEVRDFNNLSIPFRAVATDIVTGHEVVLSSGDLAMAMRASMSVPAAFSAVEIDGKLLVDGGMANNLPVSVARDMGADIVIAVDISTPLSNRNEIKNILSITAQLTGFLTNSNTERSLASLTERDILIVPNLGDIGATDFERSAEAIPTGRKAAEEMIKKLRHLSISTTQYAAHVAARNPQSSKPQIIEFVRIDNQSRLSDEVISSRLHIKTGKPLNIPLLQKDIDNIYGAGLFENVSYEIVDIDGKTGVVLTAIEKSWGPNYLQGGLALEGNFSGSNSFTIAAAYTRTAINPLGGELRSILQLGSERRLFTEWYQPLDINTRWFINPIVEIQKRNLNLFSNSGNKLAEYEVSQYGFNLEAGRELGFWGEMRGGFRWATGSAKLATGDPSLARGNFNKGEGFLRLSLDTLDNAYFPRTGSAGTIEYLASREAFGADSDYDQILSSYLMVQPLGERDSIIFGGNFSSTLNDNAPTEAMLRSGGFLRLSGFNENQITGQHLALLRSVYLRRINDFNLMPTYFGASIELGNTFSEISDISSNNALAAGSLFLGVDTLLGPIYVGYGLTEGGNGAGFLFLGNPF